MKRTRVLAAMIAAAVGMGMSLVPATVEAGIFRRRGDGPGAPGRAFVQVAKGAGKAVTHPFGGRCRRNQRGALCGAF